MTRTLIVMVKEPRPGRVKTRLGREIGHVAATWWFRHQLRSLLRRLRDPRWDLVLAVAPDTAVLSPVWPVDLPRLAQGGGDLGTRMARAMRSAPPGPVCVVGADIPGITPARVWAAFRAMGGHDAVFGPGEDGGYWLVGLPHGGRVPQGMFAGVRWSTEHALADSVASLGGARVAYAEVLGDVDTAADLSRVAGQS